MLPVTGGVELLGELFVDLYDLFEVFPECLQTLVRRHIGVEFQPWSFRKRGTARHLDGRYYTVETQSAFGSHGGERVIRVGTGLSTHCQRRPY
ncbi:hypothetical protein Harman_12420 [Haloarcula mannanilytica]|uniref:Uncharacterized protein n=1 Tax=Haloarcula mannanilytica TaxID=2509225 RepID=A0A4C2EHU4_9EURY|nr:hypothetical protein Harman_12420 [Haloarcula mannanilytica]